MLKDNQLSTVLLLVALGFLIYYLTRPNVVSEGFSEENTPELSNPEVMTEVMNEVMNEVMTEDIPEVKTEIKNEVLNQILAESELPQVQFELPTNNQMDVFQFEPNDIEQSGADLENAFQRPIPQQARPDIVDINKNNVKKYNAKDFLPKEINDEWFDTDFSQAKFNINDDILINTERYVIGVNTVGQSLKNASYDIRGTIPNPKFTVSPWNNSTYEPDFNLKSLC